MAIRILMTNEKRRELLLKMNTDQYGIYNESVQAFLQSMDEMDKVRELGGLHVIGSERHEARRIDNQLRGRSSRQGDPGSSRFYLSLEDELMRLFGGEQVDNLLRRLNIDESLPIENNLVAKLVEQSQTRVEGSNFDVRKHLLEYDDVLNMQRKRIYEQRDRVFTKEDLSEDVDEMLEKELQTRVPAALSDAEGPWKLVAYLDEIQPPVNMEGVTYPSYSYRLLLEDLKNNVGSELISADELKTALLEIARKAMEAEREHLMHLADSLLTHTEESLVQQREERFEVIDNFFQGLPDRIEEAGGSLRSQELQDELSGLVRIPLKLNGEQLRGLAEGDPSSEEAVRSQVDGILLSISMARVIGALQRRVEELDLRPAQMQGMDWEEASRLIYSETEKALLLRVDQYVGPDGQIGKDLDGAFEKIENGKIDIQQNLAAIMGLFSLMMQGSKVTFDRKTHLRGRQQVIRLTYIFYVASLLKDRDVEEVTTEVQEHLNGARDALQQVWGRYEYSRLIQNEITLDRLDKKVRDRLIDSLGEDQFQRLAANPLKEAPVEDALKIVQALGQRLQNEIYREVLLNAISQLWVDYLTRVDALRVSVGLEAFAQRDPLVQYKSQATEMFAVLLSDIRSGVAGRMFTYRPRRSSTVSMGKDHASEEPQPPSAVEIPAEAAETAESRSDRKKKRRRH